MYTRQMIKKITLALLFTIPSLSFAIDLDGFYITPKGGISKSMDTGVIFGDAGGGQFDIKDNDLGTGYVFGLSVGKYITNNFRVELEASQRGGLEYDTEYASEPNLGTTTKADIKTQSIFINGFYDFESFAIINSLVTPYIGGGIGISKNKMGVVTEVTPENEVAYLDGNKVSQFSYKLAAGTLVSLTESLSLDINYQYVDLGSFKSGLGYVASGGATGTLTETLNGGEIKTQELMVGLQYKF
jgi:opacity protein-like surface antigen